MFKNLRILLLPIIFFLSFQALSEEALKEETLTLGAVQLTLKKGITQTVVVEALGSPNMVSRGKNGKETWIYDKLSTQISSKKSKKGFDIGASVEIGDATVDASVTTSHYLPELQTYDVSTGIQFGSPGTKYVAVIRADAQNGTLFISERN